MKKIALFTFLSFFMLGNAAGQAETDLTIGQWKQHLPFRAGLFVTQSDDQVIYSTAEALLIIDKEERSRQQVTKVEGLDLHVERM